jgi:hypothetical protein
MSQGSCDTHHVGCNMGPGADIPTVCGPGRQRRRRVSTVREHWQCAPTAISAKPLRCASRGGFGPPNLLGALTIWLTHARSTAHMRSRGGTTDLVSAPQWSRCGASRPSPPRTPLPDAGDGTVIHQFTSTLCAAGAVGPATRAFNASASIGPFSLRTRADAGTTRRDRERPGNSG